MLIMCPPEQYSVLHNIGKVALWSSNVKGGKRAVVNYGAWLWKKNPCMYS